MFQVIHRRPPSGKWPHVSRPAIPVVLEEVEEHPASNVSERELEERLLDVRRQDWIYQILQLEPPAIPGTWTPLVSMSWP